MRSCTLAASAPAMPARRVRAVRTARMPERSRCNRSKEVERTEMRSTSFRKMLRSRSAGRYPSAAVSDAIDRPVVVVGDEQRSILQDQNVGGPAHEFVVLNEAGDERLNRAHGAVPVQLDHYDVAADLFGPVPGAVASDDDRIVEFCRKHITGVEAHAERRRMRPEQRDRLGELLARVAPAEFLIRYVTLM